MTTVSLQYTEVVFGHTHSRVITFTVVIFGQIQCKKSNVYSPLPFSVILQGGVRSSLFGHVNNPH